MKAGVYKQPGTARRLAVSKRERRDETPVAIIPELLTVGAGSECHVTPAHVAELMADYLGPRESILEPSAGTGSLVAAALKSSPKALVCAIEREPVLVTSLREKFAEDDILIIHADFLEARVEAYDGVLINPPFRKAKAHIQKAVSLLKPGGACVALVPITLDMGETLQTLPNDTFAHAKVNTKLVWIEK